MPSTRRNALLAPVALAALLSACTPSAPPDTSPVARGHAPTARPAPESPTSADASAGRPRPVLHFVLHAADGSSTPVLASPGDPGTAFLAKDGERGEVVRPVTGEDGRQWVEVVLPEGRGWVPQDVVTDMQWETASAAQGGTHENAPPAVSFANNGDAPASDDAGRSAPPLPTFDMHADEPDSSGGYQMPQPSTSAVADVADMNADNPGEAIDVSEHVVRGQYTIVDFYSEWCGPCRRLGPQLEQIARSNPRVVLRKVNINRAEVSGRIDWQSPIAQQYGLHSIPYVQLYNPEGNLEADGDSARAAIERL